MTENEFWQEFSVANNKEPKTQYIESFHFELTERLANGLLQLAFADYLHTSEMTNI